MHSRSSVTIRGEFSLRSAARCPLAIALLTILAACTGTPPPPLPPPLPEGIPACPASFALEGGLLFKGEAHGWMLVQPGSECSLDLQAIATQQAKGQARIGQPLPPDITVTDAAVIAPPAHGTLRFVTPTKLIYTAAAGWTGTDGFRLRVDGAGQRGIVTTLLLMELFVSK